MGMVIDVRQRKDFPNVHVIAQCFILKLSLKFNRSFLKIPPVTIKYNCFLVSLLFSLFMCYVID